MHSIRWLLCVFSLICISPIAALGEEPQPEATLPLTDSEQAGVARLYTLIAGTEIHLRLLEPVASHTHKRGDRFKLEVAQPIAVGEAIIVPAGSPAIGEVVHAAKSGMSGKAGELILATRLLSVGEREVRLRSFTAGNGENRLALATGLAATLGIPALFVVGKNLLLPAGTDVYAKVAADTQLPSVLEVGAGEVSQPAITESSTEINSNEAD
ncbi:hypothetical protein [Steroidobacter cummioxidans]|uniref:hypothetical protein n=1 Tax=Steroidobacter cummioxidans TaxID=1803913 RepID=UPI000E31909E|nr:hypothetical protein [Steroidobacter cummioxidans]